MVPAKLGPRQLLLEQLLRQARSSRARAALDPLELDQLEGRVFLGGERGDLEKRVVTCPVEDPRREG